MNKHASIVDEKLRKYYKDGFDKGRSDAIRGIRMKVLQKSLTMQYEHLREWERGYCDGYLDAIN